MFPLHSEDNNVFLIYIYILRLSRNKIQKCLVRMICLFLSSAQFIKLMLWMKEMGSFCRLAMWESYHRTWVWIVSGLQVPGPEMRVVVKSGRAVIGIRFYCIHQTPPKLRKIILSSCPALIQGLMVRQAEAVILPD